MKTPLCTLLFLLLALAASAQKITVKKDLMTVDSQPYARIEPDYNQGFGLSEMYYVASPQNERLFVVKTLTLRDFLGYATYLQFVFTATGMVVETPAPVAGPRAIHIARKIYAARLLKNGALDPQAVADFATNNGTPYSDRLRTYVPPTLVVPAGH